MKEQLYKYFWRKVKHKHDYNVMYICKKCGMSRKEIDAKHKR